MPAGVDRRRRRSDGDGGLSPRDQRREDGAEHPVVFERPAREHEPQPLTGALRPRSDAWIGRIEADAGVVDVFERARRGQQARFVGRGLAGATGMPPQRRCERESTPFDSQGIGH